MLAAAPLRGQRAHPVTVQPTPGSSQDQQQQQQPAENETFLQALRLHLDRRAQRLDQQEAQQQIMQDHLNYQRQEQQRLQQYLEQQQIHHQIPPQTNLN